eukprot:TRINITY_DN8871_c0_g1_i2.p3 TRINITY_DN8871_c0_g1~~TRINITY_DN8871_c0_g1_i2.p3  ORF type:complete len:160 (+),score=32.35 TRINITY_DN8871_c0_g1_i2:107-586(+)
MHYSQQDYEFAPPICSLSEREKQHQYKNYKKYLCQVYKESTKKLQQLQQVVDPDVVKARKAEQERQQQLQQQQQQSQQQESEKQCEGQTEEVEVEGMDTDEQKKESGEMEEKSSTAPDTLSLIQQLQRKSFAQMTKQQARRAELPSGTLMWRSQPNDGV